MTQLFDTHNHEDLDESGPIGGDRHLRILPADDQPELRTSQWRLDDQTIEIGRKGIRAARQALQDAARTNAPKTARTAA